VAFTRYSTGRFKNLIGIFRIENEMDGKCTFDGLSVADAQYCLQNFE